ncbi:MAG: response regulator [Lachnospiraceae bacterium]|nr:response regulator [Lachnospiraceae bacterium]
MENQDRKNVLNIFYIGFGLAVAFIILVAAYDLFGREHVRNVPHERYLITDWSVSVGGGEPEQIKLPVQLPVSKGTEVAFETVLPDDLTDGMWINYYTECDNEVYVDGLLRKQYYRDKLGVWGGAVKSVSFFARLYASDAGKTVRIVYKDKLGKNGRLNPVYYGDSLGLIAGDLMHYSFIMLFSVFLSFVSIVIVLFDVTAAVVNKRKPEIAHLALGVLFATLWIFYDSKIFQYVTDTLYINGSLAFMSIMLVPLPVAVYANKMQKGRHFMKHLAVATLTCGIFTVTTVLNYTETLSFMATKTAIHVVFIIMIVIELTTVVLDIAKGHLKEYSIIAIGLGITMFFGILELVQNLLGVFGNEGMFMEIGCAGALVTGFLQQLSNDHAAELERQKTMASNESKSVFIASMSHELRTPINSIIGMNEMILRENRDPQIREYANQVDHSGKLLLGMINDVLDFSKIEAGKMNIIEVPYQTVSAISDMIHMLQERTISKSLKSEYIISPDIPKELIGDEVHIKQILINLISNAVKYTKDGMVALKISCMPGHDSDCVMVRFVVSDQGIGIKKEAIATLFDRFTRADEQRNRSIEGSGLGLSIVRSLVDQMKGTISVDSEYGKGSTFTVLIPQKISVSEPIGDINEAIRRNNELENEYVEHFHAPDARILIVDDNLVNLKVAAELLKRIKVQIDTATGGKECVYKCRNTRYDLILMDHRMPDPDGIETLHLIRDDFAGVNFDTKVIVLTANVYAGIREMYLAEGFADYLSKPIDSELLEKCILKHLDPELIIPDYSNGDEEASGPEYEECNGKDTKGSCVTGTTSYEYSEHDTEAVLRRAMGRSGNEKGGSMSGYHEGGENSSDAPGAVLDNEKGSEAGPEAGTLAGGQETVEKTGDAGTLTQKSLIDNLRELGEMDVDKTVERYGSKPEFLKILFTAIITDGRKKSGEMLEFLAARDYKNFGIEAHATKSSMATIYANEISERAKQHEFACREERFDFVEQDGEAFVKDYMAFLDKIDEAMKNSSD